MLTGFQFEVLACLQRLPAAERAEADPRMLAEMMGYGPRMAGSVGLALLALEGAGRITTTGAIARPVSRTLWMVWDECLQRLVPMSITITDENPRDAVATSRGELVSAESGPDPSKRGVGVM